MIVKVVPVNLPNARNIATVTKLENIVIAVTKDEDWPGETGSTCAGRSGGLEGAVARRVGAWNCPPLDP